MNRWRGSTGQQRSQANAEEFKTGAIVSGPRKSPEAIKRALDYTSGWRKRNKEHLKKYYRKTAISRHAMDEDEYQELLASQKGGCAICGAPPLEGRHLDIDHDPSCCPGVFSCGNCIRGLLCVRCNRALGMFADNKDFLKAALEYLGRFRN